jgi:hypothetical protein
MGYETVEKLSRAVGTSIVDDDDFVVVNSSSEHRKHGLD